MIKNFQIKNVIEAYENINKEPEVYIHAHNLILIKSSFDKDTTKKSDTPSSIIIQYLEAMLYSYKDRDFKMRVDLEKITVSCIQREFSILRKVVNLFCNWNYKVPQKCVLINCPNTMKQIWSIISPLLTPEGREIIEFETKNNTKKVLLKN